MKIIKTNDSNALLLAVSALENGEIVIYPTETSYGVAVDATNPEAVEKLLEYKKRPQGKAISIAVAGRQMAEQYVELNETADRLYKQFLPGPLTVISKSRKNVVEKLESEKETLGVRISSYPLVTQLTQMFGKPITATSANSDGKKTPYTVSDILENLNEKQKELTSIILDAGDLPKNPSSTVIDTTTEELKTYRKGGIEINKDTEIYNSISVQETKDIAKKIIQKNFETIEDKPLVIFLEGDLGAGKTHFAKGVAEELKITEEIKSPTFNYIEEYEFDKGSEDEPAFLRDKKKGMMYHIDAWRLDNEKDLGILSLPSLLQKQNIVLIEWPSVIQKLDSTIFEDLAILRINIENVGETSRKIIVTNEHISKVSPEEEEE